MDNHTLSVGHGVRRADIGAGRGEQSEQRKRRRGQKRLGTWSK